MNMSLEEIARHLKTLRLHGMGATLDTRALQAAQGEDFPSVLASLVQDELDFRDSRSRERRFQASGLRERPLLGEFDWGFNPKLPKKEIYELVTVKFVREGEDALLIGSPGTGKSHVAKAVVLAAVQAGFRVIYREAHVFFEDLFEATQFHRRPKVVRLFSEADLLVIDDLFLRKRFPQGAADDLLDIILNRYNHRKSTLVTSNRPVEEWGDLLKDNAASSALLDRLMHRSRLLKFEGPSYRLKESALRRAGNQATAD